MVKKDNGAATTEATADSPLSVELVSQFLQNHPEYLSEHPELLEILIPPTRWSGDSVVDMQGLMVERMRDVADRLRDSASGLIETARTNMMVQTRTHAAVLALLAAEGLEKLAHVICFDLPLLLDIDVVSINLEKQGANDDAGGDIRFLPADVIDEILGGPDQQVRLDDHIRDDGTIFGEAAGLVRSAALVRLDLAPALPPGVLAMGTRRIGTFNPAQGADLLNFLARVVEHSLRRWAKT
ncbi:MAG: DUF484 family protein [Proteobacteria bacterium]|nr:DUF484 family protein [Pseudomonadota bacterium]